MEKVPRTGLFRSMRAELVQLLAQKRGGAIVNVGSIAGLIGLAGNPAYVASKHGVTGLTRNAAIDYAPYGIRVNSVNMAATATPMTESAFSKVSELMNLMAADPSRAKLANMGMLKTQSLLMYADSNHRMACPSAIFHPWQNAGMDHELSAMFCAMRRRVGESSGRKKKEVRTGFHRRVKSSPVMT